jgi:hydroxypyruvate reductase
MGSIAMDGVRELVVLRRDLDAIVRAAIDAVDPVRLVTHALEHLDETHLGARIWLVCAGKAANAMAAGASAVLGSRVVGGVVISPKPVADLPNLEYLSGGHPLPTKDSEHAGRRALAITRLVQAGERLLCLLSGGASALMEAPAAGVTLEDEVQATSRLLKAGADIRALNCVRKHLSDIKGGGLAVSSASGCHTLAISDVVGDDLSVIGSGPGVPDESRFQDAIETLRKFGGLNAYPQAVVSRLRAGEQGQLLETLKPTDPRAADATGEVIAGRLQAMQGASSAAERLGYRVIEIEEAIVGEVRDAAAAYARRVATATDGLRGPACFVSSGETTVHVTGSGRGGRNQEFALASIAAVGALGERAALASVGTDGVDGPTDAAGAVVDGRTAERARDLQLDADVFLRRNDSGAFFEALGDRIMTGPTGTNVGDVQILLIDRPR